MSEIRATVEFKMAKAAAAATKDKAAQAAVSESAVVTLILLGTSEMEHELLLQFFGPSRSVTLTPFHEADLLESRFVIQQDGAFAKAQRACENRIRVRDGRPTVDEDEARAKLIADFKAKKEAADAAAQKEGYADADDKAAKTAEAAEFDRLASAIADKLKPADKPKDDPQGITCAAQRKA